jgi:hypothetical protein
MASLTKGRLLLPYKGMSIKKSSWTHSNILYLQLFLEYIFIGAFATNV